MKQQYKIDILTLTGQNSSVRSDCGDITFYNYGTNKVQINDAITLLPSESISFSANYNEIDRTIYNFKFLTFGTNISRLIVIRKIYI